MIRLLRFLSLFMFVFFAQACNSQTDKVTKKTAQTVEALQDQLEVVLNEMKVPGMSIAIVNKEGPELIAGIGHADLASGRPATSNTLFRIGSISKGFVSLAVLNLVQEGKISLDDTLAKLAPEVLFKNKWESTDPIRVVNLLENTTGWDDMHFCEFAKDPQGMSTIQRINYNPTSRTSRWRPGTRMSYCNSGPAVAAYLVEKITGKKFEEVVQESFFNPIGMYSTTYLQPPQEAITSLYESDGKTVHPYWELLYPSIGAINSSAIDMANYLSFYLNQGLVKGSQVIPASLFNRIENPTSTWSAKSGLKIGYGLNNYTSLQDGFIFHGHDGNVPGGLSMLSYLPQEGVGYYFSINSENREALTKIDDLIRNYILRHLTKLEPPQTIPLSQKTAVFSGWYVPDSPRMSLLSFLERLFGKTYLNFEQDALLLNLLNGDHATYLPATETAFFYVNNKSIDPLPSLQLLSEENEKFVQISLGKRNAAVIHTTLRQIPNWLSIVEILSTIFVLTLILSILIISPLKLIQNARKNYSVDILFLWPLVAILSLLSTLAIVIVSKDNFIFRFGNLSVSSISLFLLTLLFAASSITSLIISCSTPKYKSCSLIGIYSILATFALCLTTIYLSYTGIIGIRTWN